jgi:hypothetical protein
MQTSNDSKDQFKMSLCLLTEKSERKLKVMSVIARNLLQSHKKEILRNKKRWLQQGQV